MKKIKLIIGFVLFGTILFAQNNDAIIPKPLNSINIGLLGDASILSINFERLFLITPTFILSSKVGLGYNKEFNFCLWGPCSPPEKFSTIPHHITGNLGARKAFFEFGLGGTIINGNTPQHYILYPMIGLRFLPLRSNKINFRMVVQLPISRYDNGNGILSQEDILFIPLGFNIGVSY